MYELLHALGAHACVSCDDAPAEGFLGGRLCAGCAAELAAPVRDIPTPVCLRTARALGRYAGPLGALVRHAKYRGDLGVASGLAGALTRDAPPDGVTAVVPVPTTFWRRTWRGGHFAESLAQAVAASWGLPVLHALRRVDGAPQASLGRRARRTNARGAFAASRAVDGDLLLVDDVVTTGATASACAQALLLAGARSVRLVAVASTDATIVRDS